MSELPTSKEAQDVKIADARSQGFTIVYDDDYTLLLDLDSNQAHDMFYENLGVLQQYLEVVIHDHWHSKSSTPEHRRSHVILKLGNPLDTASRHLLQASLGSDPKRELLYWIQARTGPSRANVLFKPPVSKPDEGPDDNPF